MCMELSWLRGIASWRTWLQPPTWTGLHRASYDGDQELESLPEEELAVKVCHIDPVQINDMDVFEATEG